MTEGGDYRQGHRGLTQAVSAARLSVERYQASNRDVRAAAENRIENTRTARATTHQQADHLLQMTRKFWEEGDALVAPLGLDETADLQYDTTAAPGPGLAAAHQTAETAVLGIRKEIVELGEFQTKRRNNSIASGVVLLLIAISGILWANQRIQTARAANEVVSVMATSASIWAATVEVAAGGELLRTLKGHASEVASVAFSPDGATLASGSNDRRIKLWRIADGSLVRTLDGHNTLGVEDVAFSPDSRLLASGARDGIINIWKVEDGSLVRSIAAPSSVFSIAFSPDGEMLASGSSDGRIILWQVNDGTQVQTMLRQSGIIWSLAFTPDGQQLASAHDFEGINIWQVRDGSLLHELSRPYAVRGIAFSPNGQILVSGGEDGTVEWWQVSNGSSLLASSDVSQAVTDVVFSPNEAIYATSHRASREGGGVVTFWTSDIGRNFANTNVPCPNSIDFSPDAKLLAVASCDRTIEILRVPKRPN